MKTERKEFMEPGRWYKWDPPLDLAIVKADKVFCLSHALVDKNLHPVHFGYDIEWFPKGACVTKKAQLFVPFAYAGKVSLCRPVFRMVKTLRLVK